MPVMRHWVIGVVIGVAVWVPFWWSYARSESDERRYAVENATATANDLSARRTEIVDQAEARRTAIAEAADAQQVHLAISQEAWHRGPIGEEEAFTCTCFAMGDGHEVWPVISVQPAPLPDPVRTMEAKRREIMGEPEP